MNMLEATFFHTLICLNIFWNQQLMLLFRKIRHNFHEEENNNRYMISIFSPESKEIYEYNILICMIKYCQK